MEKQEIKSYPQKQHSIVGRIFYGVGILTGIAIVCGLLFWRNPFMIPSVDASEESVSWQPGGNKGVRSGESYGFEIYRVLYGGYKE